MLNIIFCYATFLSQRFYRFVTTFSLSHSTMMDFSFHIKETRHNKHRSFNRWNIKEIAR